MEGPRNPHIRSPIRVRFPESSTGSLKPALDRPAEAEVHHDRLMRALQSAAARRRRPGSADDTTNTVFHVISPELAFKT